MECPICYSDTPKTHLVCGHSFCNECAKEWYMKCQNVEPTCPMCRNTFYFKGLTKVAERWDDERIERQYQSVFERVFDELLEFFEDMDFLGHMQEKYQILFNDEYYWAEEDLYYILADVMIEVTKRANKYYPSKTCVPIESKHPYRPIPRTARCREGFTHTHRCSLSE